MEFKNARANNLKDETDKTSMKFDAGDKVVILKTGKVTTVTGIKDGMYERSSNNGNFYDGVFCQDELNKF